MVCKKGNSMKNGIELLYYLVNEHYPTERYGHHFVGSELSFPAFYVEGMELVHHKIYICKTKDLPLICPEECIFICIGEKPSLRWNDWKGTVFHIKDKEVDLFTALNCIMGFFDKFTRWESLMKHLIVNNAGIAELVKASLPVFDNCISVIDYNLRMLADSEVAEENGKIKAKPSENFDFVPDHISVFFADRYDEYVKNEEPYIYKGQPINPNGTNYCINLFVGGNYILTCILRDEIHPLKESDFISFQQFADYIALAISSKPLEDESGIVTIKKLIRDIIKDNPIRGSDLNILNKKLGIDLNNSNWHCLAIKQASKNTALPPNYLCSIIEKLLPESTAIPYENMILCVCGGKVRSGIKNERILKSYLEKTDFWAGISSAFTDIADAKIYFNQAKQLMNMGLRVLPEKRVYTVEEDMITYMLDNCSGEFNSEMLLSDSLHKLKNLDSNVDYWDTLKVYLDNECNASKTAKDLYIHRSTLLTRIERISSIVDMETPLQKLYLRICINIFDLK